MDSAAALRLQWDRTANASVLSIGAAGNNATPRAATTFGTRAAELGPAVCSGPPQQLRDIGTKADLQDDDAPEQDAERALDRLVPKEPHRQVRTRAAADGAKPMQHQLRDPAFVATGTDLVVTVV